MSPPKAVGAERNKIVEIDQHHRVLSDANEKVGEAPEDVWPKRFTLECADRDRDLWPFGRDREVVAPEMNQSLAKRDVAFDGRIGATTYFLGKNVECRAAQKFTERACVALLTKHLGKMVV